MNEKSIMNRYKIVSVIALISCIFLLVLPRIVPVCSGLINGITPMACHYTYQAEFAVTLLGVVLSGSLFVLRTGEARLVVGITLLLIGVITIVLPQPWAMGICRHPAAACHRTFFWTAIGGEVLIIASTWIAWHGRKRQQEEGSLSEAIDLEKSDASQTAKFGLDRFDCSRSGDRF